MPSGKSKAKRLPKSGCKESRHFPLGQPYRAPGCSDLGSQWGHRPPCPQPAPEQHHKAQHLPSCHNASVSQSSWDCRIRIFSPTPCSSVGKNCEKRAICHSTHPRPLSAFTGDTWEKTLTEQAHTVLPCCAYSSELTQNFLWILLSHRPSQAPAETTAK